MWAMTEWTCPVCGQRQASVHPVDMLYGQCAGCERFVSNDDNQHVLADWRLVETWRPTPPEPPQHQN
jgi:RNA polymerase subunit RPABC4/transcription elongation factor Spt4